MDRAHYPHVPAVVIATIDPKAQQQSLTHAALAIAGTVAVVVVVVMLVAVLLAEAVVACRAGNRANVLSNYQNYPEGFLISSCHDIPQNLVIVLPLIYPKTLFESLRLRHFWIAVAFRHAARGV